MAWGNEKETGSVHACRRGLSDRGAASESWRGSVDVTAEVDAAGVPGHTRVMVARPKTVRERAQASEQARVLRVLAERIETHDAPLPARVFVPLRELVAANDELPPDEWEAVWVKELERRLAAVRSGKVKRIPASKVIEDALAVAKRSVR